MRLSYYKDKDTLYTYDGHYWVPTGARDVEAMIMRENGVGLTEARRLLREKVASIRLDGWEPDHSLLAFDNTLLRLPEREKELLGHDLACVRRVECDFDPYAKCESWTGWLDKVMCGNYYATRFLQEYVGACLGRLPIKERLLLKGSWRSGVSEVVEILGRLVPCENDGRKGDWYLSEPKVWSYTDGEFPRSVRGEEVVVLDFPLAVEKPIRIRTLELEFPGIVNWALDGMTMVLGNEGRLTTVREVRPAKNAFDRWLQDLAYYPEKGLGIEKEKRENKSLYSEYEFVARKVEDEEVLSREVWGRKMRAAGFESFRSRKGKSRGYIVWRGKQTRVKVEKQEEMALLPF